MATDTIFNPKDDTLKERFSSFEYVNTCYNRDKENYQKHGDFLGETGEIKQAYTISKHSLQQAHQSISEEELKNGYNNGLLNNEQIKEFKQSKNMLEMETKREDSLSNSSQTSQQMK